MKPRHNYIHTYMLIIIILTFLESTSSIDLTLTNQQTCLDYQVTDVPSKKIFYFHYNHNMDSVRMMLYRRNSKLVLKDSGVGIDYENNLDVTYEQVGNYTVCFIKNSQSSADVTFEMLDETQLSEYAGKQDLNKVSKRVSQCLVHIKRVGWVFKNVIEQFNKRKQSLLERDNYYGFLLVVKAVVMLLIIVIQIYVFKSIFK